MCFTPGRDVNSPVPLLAISVHLTLYLRSVHLILINHFQAKDFDSLPTINVLIIGARGCGKSSFIRNSLDRESFLPESGSGLSARVKLTDQYYSIKFLELEIDEVDFSSERRIIWPPHANGSTFPALDAVFCLYDASDKDSVADVPTALSKWNSEVKALQVCTLTSIFKLP